MLEDVEEGDGGLVVVQASHKSNVETPGDLATGQDDMGLVKQPVLKAGDLFLLAETTLQGMRPWTGAETAVDVLVCGAGGYSVEWARTGC